MNKSRQRIADAYSTGVERILKSSAKKKAEQQKNQGEDSHQNTESVVEAVQEKKKMTVAQQLDHTEGQYKKYDIVYA